jgi:hypothetical protein
MSKSDVFIDHDPNDDAVLWFLKTSSARDSSGRDVSGTNDIGLKRRTREREPGRPLTLAIPGPSPESRFVRTKF